MAESDPVHPIRPALRLVLFDIDGTLLVTNGLGRRVVTEVLSEQLGREVDFYGASFSGKTDPQIFRELLDRERTAGATVDDLDTAMHRALAAYEARMSRAISEASITVLAGAKLLVDKLARREDVLLGLLTGNLESFA